MSKVKPGDRIIYCLEDKQVDHFDGFSGQKKGSWPIPCASKEEFIFYGKNLAQKNELEVEFFFDEIGYFIARFTK